MKLKVSATLDCEKSQQIDLWLNLNLITIYTSIFFVR